MTTTVAAVRRYQDDGMPERAPGLAYYGILSLFPGLLLSFSIMRFVAGRTAPEDIADYLRRRGASGPLGDIARSAVDTALATSQRTAGTVGFASIAVLVYGASRAYTATGLALDRIARQHRVPRTLRRRVADVLWSLVLVAAMIAALLLVLVSGRVLEDVLGLVGLSGDAVTTWRIVRWPAAGLLAFGVTGLVRWTAPSGERPPLRFLSVGVLATVAILFVATLGFAWYVTHGASYNATYGAFAGGIVLMLWIWLAGSALLFGAALDAVRAERRDQPSTSPTSRARATASERDDASSLR